MARWNDLAKLRMEMEKLQAQVKNLHNRGYKPSEIADIVGSNEKAVKVMIKWLNKKGW